MSGQLLNAKYIKLPTNPLWFRRSVSFVCHNHVPSYILAQTWCFLITEFVLKYILPK